MSVLKSKRSVSDIQFLNTARELEAKTRRRCVAAPKRYTFYGLQELYKTARKIHSCVKRANSIYPNNLHEVQMRKDYFIYASVGLQDYISQLELLLEDNILTYEGGEELSGLAYAEIKLVKAMIKSDKSRYADIKE